MEITYVIKVLSKKDAKLDYKAPIKVTQKILAQEKGIKDPKIILRFKYYRPTQEVFEDIYKAIVWGTKAGFDRYKDMIPNVELKDVISFKALYKGIMNVFVKIDDEIINNGESSITITDYANMILTIVSEVIKTNYIRTTFYNIHANDENIKSFVSHILGAATLGIARWFGYKIANQEEGHEILQKLFSLNMNKIKNIGDDDINAILFWVEDALTYIDETFYFVEELEHS